MRYYCKVAGCNSKSSELDVRFFSFPRVKTLCKLWVAFTGNAVLEERWLTMGNVNRSSSRICSKHFKDNDFTNCWKERLNRGVVPSLNGPYESSRHMEASEKPIGMECLATNTALYNTFIKEEILSDDEPDIPDCHSGNYDEDIINIKPAGDSKVSVVIAANSEENSGNGRDSDSIIEDGFERSIEIPCSDVPEEERLCPTLIAFPEKKRESFTIERKSIAFNKCNYQKPKDLVEDNPIIETKPNSSLASKKCCNAKMRSWLNKIESYFSGCDISPKMNYGDLVDAEIELNSVYAKLMEKSAELLEMIPIHILKEITGLDAFVFVEMKSIRKRLSAKQNLIRSYLKKKESGDDIKSDINNIQRLSKVVGAKNQNLLPAAKRPSSNLSAQGSDKTYGFSTVSSSPLATRISHDHSDIPEKNVIIMNNESYDAEQLCTVIKNSSTSPGLVKFKTISLKANSTAVILQDSSSLALKSAKVSHFNITDEIPVSSIGTNTQSLQEKSGTSICNQDTGDAGLLQEKFTANDHPSDFQHEEGETSPCKMKEMQGRALKKVKMKAVEGQPSIVVVLQSQGPGR